MTKKYLFDINSPQDVKKIPQDQLPILCQEIRDLIIKVVSMRGGHLASSLGAVEIITALHYLFDAPHDKIIWDVGHQAYAHKILTGRREQFCSLRTYKGISGFPNQFESIYDTFIVGHANTAISVGLGMLTAMNMRRINGKVISVIGDATLTGGMAYEALNNAGHMKKNFLVILNDNEMAISKNVGGMSKYLNKIITAPIYNRLKKDISLLLEKIPTIGHNVIKTSQKLEESIKNLIVPGIIFEELGFRYFGPVDGNDIFELIKIIKSIKDNSEPTILHVITKKGKGYKPAEENPESFHGAVPFIIETGEPAKKTSVTRYTDVFGDALVDIAKENTKVVAITAAMCSGTGLKQFEEKFPDRFFDVGIAEQHAVTFAGGMAKEGMRPIVAIYSTFLQRSYDQVMHDVCLQNVPVCFAIDRGGLVGTDGPTHHGVFDLSYLRNIPRMVVAQPKDGNELRSLLKTSVNYDGPFAIRFPRNTIPAPMKNEPMTEIPVGTAEIIRQGSDAHILTLGNHVYIAQEVCDKLANEGLNVGVVNARFIKPLDLDMIKTVIKDNKPIITIEDNVLMGGFGSAVLEAIQDMGFHAVPVLRLGIKDEFITHGELPELYHLCGLDSEGIRKSIESFLERISSRSIFAISE
ncbi:MAG: 1-deoxy-D-xylulose-5-phosphate synthase [Candidatus Auribacterota bacterium]|jgi:1-deoxy-D-xylulose-5-phosphate synthase|nr:1-deoxy-D-xylulose-5-phosphate synthase [Candidatus Auribacterota bacterium]